jgi:hypothetical protein
MACAITAFARVAAAQAPPPPAPAPGYPPPGYAPGYAPGYPPPGYAPGYAPVPGYGYGYGYGAPPPQAAERPLPKKGPPPARRGFQLGLRTGVALPIGLASSAPGDGLRERYSSQWVLEVDLGAKVTDALFVGGYFGFGVGAEGSDERIEGFCDDDGSDSENDIQCSVVGFRIGVLGRWSFLPAGTINPWLAYGIGYEAQSQSINDRIVGRREETTAGGFEFARLSAGFDWRPGKTFGFGPLLEASLGSYTNTSTEVNDETTFEGDVEDSAIHTWVTLAIRGVFFP